MTASLNEIYKLVGELNGTMKAVNDKVDGLKRDMTDSEATAASSRANMHRRVDDLVGEVGSVKTRVVKIEADVADTKEVTDEVRAWKQRGIGALAIVGFGASAVTFAVTHYFDQIVAWFRG